MPLESENSPFCPFIKGGCRKDCQIFIQNPEGSNYCAIFSIESIIESVSYKIGALVHAIEQIRAEGGK